MSEQGGRGGRGGRTGWRPKSALAGLGLAALYLLAAAVTPHLSGRPLRPLFDGFAPPAPYAWVNPPPEFAKDNRKPTDATQDVALGPDGSAASNSTTSDGQAIAGLDAGSAPPHAPDTTVRVQVTPVDPGTLGPLPTGLRPEGNAYRITLTYEPSGQALTTLAKPGTVALTAAAPASTLLFSADGRTWQDVNGRPFGDSNGLFAQLTGPGYFLPTSHNPARTAGARGGGSGSGAVLAVVGGVIVIGGAVAGVVVTRRRSTASRPRKPAPGSARRRRPGS
ncbi:MAG TPA: hypothetical protein VL337_02520 [Acidimicrobiales bacterium]|nr:hypothetical protein [Acidimicrobiales bacterium]